jgi:glycosyltransferase involved in cell wall biosynthesis
VNLLPENPRYAVIEKPMREALCKGFVDIVAARLMARVVHHRYASHRDAAHKNDASIFYYVAKYTTPLLPSLKKYGKYDLAISFLTPHQIVCDKVDARKKIAWIHTDYTVCTVNERAELPMWRAFDNIVSISSEVTKTFLVTFPQLTEKITEIENILSPAFVREQAIMNDVSAEFTGCVNLLSVGRFSDAKNYDNLPDICRCLVAVYPRLKWYIIGYGGDEPLIRRAIAEAGMEEHVILLGKKENPYPYIKACDIYVQPSRYEGKSVTVREAQMLCKPVVVTNYPTASSQIQDGIDGVIVPMDNEGCAQGIAKVIADTSLQKRIINYLFTHDYGNESEVEKIYNLIN